MYDHRRMPWGKYRGWLLTEIPPGYLEWVLDNCLDADPWLRRDITRVLAEAREEAEEEVEAARRTRAGPPADWPDILRSVHREMCLRFHPDRGGSTEAMQAVNVFFERLQQLCAAG